MSKRCKSYQKSTKMLELLSKYYIDIYKDICYTPTRAIRATAIL